QDEVIIQATRATDKTPATYINISRDDIEKLNMVKDIPYLVENTPSIVTTSDAGIGVGYTWMSIRGTDITRINVTMNGIPLNDPESQSLWFVDLPDLASSIEQMQIQRGVGTSTNGPAAFGASINMQSLGRIENPYGEIEANAGSFNTFKGSLKFGSGLIRERFTFDGRLSYIRSDGYIDRAGSLLKSYYLSGGYYGKKDLLKINILSGTEKTYQAWYGVPGDSLATNRRYNPAGEYFDPDGNRRYYDNQTDNYRQDHYQLIYSHGFNKKLNLNLALHYTKGSGYYENYEPGESFRDYGLDDVIIGGDTITESDLINRKMMDNDFYGITLSSNFDNNKNLHITFGGAWSRYDGDHFGKIIWAQYASNGDINRNWYESNGLKEDFNLYLKTTLTLWKKWSFFGDIQYRYVDYRINGKRDDGIDLTQQHFFPFWNPKAGVFWEINHQNNLYFSFAIANREPSRSNYRDADRDRQPKYETLYDFELGHSLIYPKFRLSTNIYYMYYRNQLILTGEINNVGASIMTNAPSSYRAGLEIASSLKLFRERLQWDANMTISSNKVHQFTAYVDEYDQDWNFLGQQTEYLGETNLAFAPSVIGNSIISIRPVTGMSVAWIARYIGKQYIDNTSSNDRKLDPYFVNNLRLNYVIRTNWIREIEFMLSANNLFSEKYESNAWVYRYILDQQEYKMDGFFPQATIHFLGGVTFRF
ncbi:MAG: TonB-dependent receptor, partial [Bacteroidetes bacterium]|nr:TonB-dependent receptor [Bacteroidota bacterium]